MLTELIIILSTLLQLAAALAAFRLIRITGNRCSWGFISSAIFLMAVRRAISLSQYVPGGNATFGGFWFEGIGLLISALMLAGIIMIKPLFQSMASLISNLTKAEETARKNEKKLNDIASHLAEGIYMLDQGGLSFINPEAERLIGWTFAELKDKNMHEVTHYINSDGSPLSNEECPMHGVKQTGQFFSSTDQVFVRKDGTVFPISVISSPILENGKVVAAVTAFRDISEQKKLETEKENLIRKLQESLDTIKTLHGILPICASCKKIRDDQGYWNQVEVYVRDHTDAEFSHGLCPECAKKLYSEYCTGSDGQKKT